MSGGRGRLLTHVHRASACTLNAVGLLPVSRAACSRVLELVKCHPSLGLSNFLFLSFTRDCVGGEHYGVGGFDHLPEDDFLYGEGDGF